jgi:hypothetical protein
MGLSAAAFGPSCGLTTMGLSTAALGAKSSLTTGLAINTAAPERRTKPRTGRVDFNEFELIRVYSFG